MGRDAHHGALLLTRTVDFEPPDTGSLIPAGKALPWLDSRDPAVNDGDHLSLGQRHEGRALSGSAGDAGLRQAAPGSSPYTPLPEPETQAQS
ncbi:hypothetical protein PAL_GLEAN10000780 [Pteropus alecto]|uniref:Uncharacterized protein n=1 Tax=Pteropus alecto TaxID=9402 RepID=L5KWP4_PTEAL|nr:hypothetical protein PAL_GLEAN10000780 [Pteropus alecto]